MKKKVIANRIGATDDTNMRTVYETNGPTIYSRIKPLTRKNANKDPRAPRTLVCKI